MILTLELCRSETEVWCRMQGMQEAQVMQNQEKSQVAVKEEEVTGIQLLARGGEEAD